MAKVTMLGLGAMGSRMAAAIMKAGHDVTVWNRNTERAKALISAGAKTAPTPRRAVAAADFAISMLRDDDASREVWLDKADGALAGLPKGAVAIESSTLSMNYSRELAESCEVQSIAFLEAPVSGSLPQVEASQLVYFVGGTAEVLATASPILKIMGAVVNHVGEAGSGAAVKLAVNALLSVQIATLAELIGMLREQGLEINKAVEAITSTAACGPAIKGAAQLMLSGNLTPMFPIDLVQKDLTYLGRLVDGTRSPLADAARKVFAEAIEKGFGSKNITAVASLYR